MFARLYKPSKFKRKTCYFFGGHKIFVIIYLLNKQFVKSVSMRKHNNVNLKKNSLAN